LTLVLSGKSFKDIALFVSQHLAPLDAVLSTVTHFVLSPYKKNGIVVQDIFEDERGNASL
ncbi:MAG: Lrp/AsnC family transcriptional regulator, partial [Oscillospiraceae bacterium]